MSLNNIHLSPHLLVNLYPDVLIETQAIPVPVKGKPQFLGNNDKHILVVVNHEHAAYLTDDELSFLTKVLGACELSIADVAIINWYSIPVKDYQALLQDLKSRTVLLFGVDTIRFGLPLRLPDFQIQHFDQRTYLQGPALSQIEKDVAAKKNLWTSLKQLFSI